MIDSLIKQLPLQNEYVLQQKYSDTLSGLVFAIFANFGQILRKYVLAKISKKANLQKLILAKKLKRADSRK